MQMPDAVALLYYLPRNTFLDKNSEEKSTGIVKPKYKLLFKHHKEMGVFVFFVLTTEKSACVQERTCPILFQDWEERQGTHLNADCSYLDVQKHIVMNKDEVISKASNPIAGFSYAGKVYQAKFSELSGMVQAYVSSSNLKTDFTIRDILKSIVVEDRAGIFVSKFQI